MVVSCLEVGFAGFLVLGDFLLAVWVLWRVVSLLLGFGFGWFVGFGACGLVWYVFWCLQVS